MNRRPSPRGTTRSRRAPHDAAHYKALARALGISVAELHRRGQADVEARRAAEAAAWRAIGAGVRRSWAVIGGLTSQASGHAYRFTRVTAIAARRKSSGRRRKE